MKSLLVVAGMVGVGFAVLPAGAAAAHPLGNFSVNRSATLTVHPDRIDALAIADLAELPTLQDEPASCEEAAAALTVTVNDAAVRWTIGDTSLTYPAGAGGLKTSRLECRLSASASLTAPARIDAANRFRDDRIGWRELVAVGSGVRLQNSPLPTQSPTNNLRSYPSDPLVSPSDVRSATLTTVPDSAASSTSRDQASAPPSATSPGPAAQGSSQAAESPGHVSSSSFAQSSGLLGGFEQRLDDLVGGTELTPLVGLLAVLLSLVLGAAHAALPGHGKTVMAAYLAGSQGRPRDAVLVGATVTFTHTAGVIALGLILTAVSGVAGETVLGYLGLASGTLVTTVGVGALVPALSRRTTTHLTPPDSNVHAHAESDTQTDAPAHLDDVPARVPAASDGVGGERSVEGGVSVHARAESDSRSEHPAQGGGTTVLVHAISDGLNGVRSVEDGLSVHARAESDSENDDPAHLVDGSVHVRVGSDGSAGVWSVEDCAFVHARAESDGRNDHLAHGNWVAVHVRAVSDVQDGVRSLESGASVLGWVGAHDHAPGQDEAHGRGQTSGHDHAHGHDESRARRRAIGRRRSHHHAHGHGETHGHGHVHGHGHGHTHAHGAGRWGLAGLGVAGGLVPSPSALIVLLGAAALGRTVFGVLLVIAYGFGMAATLTAAGLLLVRLRHRIDGRWRWVARWQAVAPSATAALIILVGVGLAGRALAGVA
ncbi:sulfite exporter TauE/SafE family protein [Actinoplanes sp. Pm04-4]|uniref:Sulfite exporter TauE/SafE family protein n=1 Tax=Paractinoplanes pyxinae TaxID=2997416 RepID=A0ABT4AV90_9ACTN|nr:sulfite exporter TauE/SafE family protein [Actinoplanes pyxinae]MCY1138151.1 sulfite exporter TauE/SafE family protein [Actinoplanes pyxinae]